MVSLRSIFARRPGTRAMVRSRWIWGAAIAVLVLGGGAYGAYALVSPVDTQVSPATTVKTPPPFVSTLREPNNPPPGPVTFTLVAAGDVLPHSAVLTSARAGGSYDFSPLFASIEPWISGADLALCHMEVPIAPPGSSPAGYPIFAAPVEIARDLKESGWDGCSTASNHSVDKRFDGVVATLDAFDAVNLRHVGTARTAAEAAKPQWYSVREGSRTIRVAHLSTSYGTNGLPVPSDKPWAVNVFNPAKADVSQLLRQAQEARDAGADVVIVSVHCCVEYVTEPNAVQRLYVQKIADSGLVDLYIGHHAHVPQPVERLSGGPNGDGMWAAFGLGNFISNQSSHCCVAASSNGLLLTATFTVELDGTVDVGAQWTPITVDRLGGHKVYALTEIPNGIGTLSKAEVAARIALVRGAAGPDATELGTPAAKLADAAFGEQRKPWAPGD